MNDALCSLLPVALSASRDPNMFRDHFLKTLVTATLMSASVLNLSSVCAMSANEDEYVEELTQIESLAKSGEVAAVASRLEAICEEFKSSDIPPEKRSMIMQQALRIALWSDVGQDDAIKATAADCAFAIISATRGKAIVSRELFQQQMQLALEILPRTNASSDRIGEVSLQLWGDLLVATADLSDYDSSHPKVVLDIPTPPVDYNGTFRSGMDPSGITDPEFRRQYEEFLKKRDEFNRKSNDYRRLCNLQKRFLPKLQSVLASAYSGDSEKTKAGIAAIEKYVSDPAMREVLLKAIQVVSETNPRDKPTEELR